MTGELAHGIQLDASASSIEAFVRAYLDADDDADIEMRGARSEAEPAVVYILIGKQPFALPTRDVRWAATFLERQMHLFHGAPEVAGFADMIMHMRFAADAVDAEAKSRTPAGE